MKIKRNRTQIYLLLIFSLALLIGVGYAALFETLKINGQTTINKASWDIYMKDISVTSGSVEATTIPSLNSTNTSINFTVKLTNPGDFYEFTVKEVNAGTIDGMISTISKTGLTATQAKYLDYTAAYSDDTALAEKQLLKSNQSEILKVRIAFKKDITAADLPTVDSTLNLNFNLSYQQADETAVAVVHPICKRATALHTEICNQTSGYCADSGYKIGDTITYGNLGTTGVLTTGDAFDCDVNGDGVFDSKTERFYYVSEKDGDDTSDYATLIYYNNVSGGVPDNTKTYAYNTDTSDYLGPQTSIKQLPTTTQWKNVTLSSTTRNITDEDGTIRVNNFSYAGYATRLLTYQEVYVGCYDKIKNITLKGGLDKKCQYLMENTKYSTASNKSYGSWLESTRGDLPYAYYSWSPLVYIRKTNDFNISNSSINGVRPAIEVEKAKINY